MELYLIRHGESTWNVEGRLQGQAMHVPLTALGELQAAQAAEELAGEGIVALWSSDQLRAEQTARIIGERLGISPRCTALLREQGLGELEGRLASELQPEPTPPGKHISEVAWGGGESICDVHRRLQGLCAVLREEHGPDERVALVSHGDTLRVLLAVLQGRGHRDVDWVPIANGSVTQVRWAGRGTVSRRSGPRRWWPRAARRRGRGG
ncbi:histidine phosphatase family protein [uncultured Tessaracoccus sp.]|uniref:histidine phosphatase family protein n=1 Tax=uncultured Tessaracoccus sp. TaxID=905023 RepID=UPI002612212E|nr:histidine phosphatase family protein [uncultured Tessaracoccus sp.]